MSGRQGFITNGETYVYQESPQSKSAAFGLDSADNKWKLLVLNANDAVPTTGQFIIDPAAAGNITFSPNSTGKLVISNQIEGALVTTSSGVVSSITGTAGYVLTANASGSAPTFQAPSSGGVTSIAGTANQITASAATGAVTLSIPSTFIAPGSIAATTTVTAGTNLVATSGNLVLPQTTSSIGQVVINTIPYLHAYGDSGSNTNVFVGNGCGNFTMTDNTAIANTALGYQCLAALTTGTENCGVGDNACHAVTTGTSNLGFGHNGMKNVTTGSYNTGIGVGAGSNYTSSESYNVVLGLTYGTAAESNVMRLGNDGSYAPSATTKTYIVGIDGVNVGSVAKVLTMASNQLGTATITAGTNITITPGANTITIAASGGMTWTEVSGTTVALAVANGYILNNSSGVVATLPATCAVGDIIAIVGKGTGGWSIAQNSGDIIHFSGLDTSTGTGGSLSSTNRYDCVEIICIVANGKWVVRSSIGNLTVV